MTRSESAADDYLFRVTVKRSYRVFELKMLPKNRVSSVPIDITGWWTLRVMTPTFAIPGSIVFEMAMRGGPLPTRVEIPKDRDAPVTITCTDEQALEMEAWLRIAGRQRRDAEADLYLKCAALIARGRGAGG